MKESQAIEERSDKALRDRVLKMRIYSPRSPRETQHVSPARVVDALSDAADSAQMRLADYISRLLPKQRTADAGAISTTSRKPHSTGGRIG
jgi:hypothetical protein